MITSTPATLTIGRLARASGVGVETVRYYQELGLLPCPAKGATIRRYPSALVERIRFIKRAQNLGFLLSEIADLLALDDGTQRGPIRDIAGKRLEQIEVKLQDLQRMRRALKTLLAACAESDSMQPCPIIATLAGRPG
jgi:MerR family mercuric resistance operon transcriptional regulator